METGNWIALGGVMVALVSNGVTLHLGNRRLRFDDEQSEERLDHERRLEDRRVAGAILDEAVEMLRTVDLNLPRIMAMMRRHPERFHYRPAGKAAFAELEAALPRITQMLDRLSFRFGSGSISLAFERCYECSGGIVVHLGEIVTEEFDAIDDKETRNKARSYCRDQADEVTAAADRFGQSFEEFRAAAYDVIGIRP